VTGPTQTAAFDLLSNPFARLGVGPDSSIRDVEDALEDALADEVAPEAELQKARQILLTPRLRLAAEVSYLLDVEPATVREVIDRVKSGLAASDAPGFANRLHALPRSNLLAHVFAHAPAAADVLVELVEAQSACAPGAVVDAINDARDMAGMVKTDRDAVIEALRTLFEKQDKAVLAAFADPVQTAEAVSQTVERLVGNGDSALAECLDALVVAYGQVADPELSRRREVLRSACTELRGHPNDADSLAAAASALRAWSIIGQPLQILEAHKGRDDPRARETYSEIRELGLELANDGGHYAVAEKLLRASMDAFSDLPRAREQMAEELAILEGNLTFALVKPLVDYIEEITPKLAQLDADLRNGGFDGRARGTAKHLFDLFLKAVENTQGTPHVDMPWAGLRDLAITLNNDLDSPQGALVLLRGMLARANNSAPSAEWRERLASDERAAERHFAQIQLGEHVKAGDIEKGLAVVEDLLRDFKSPEERDVLLQVRANLERKKTSRLVRRLLWGAVGVGAIIFVVADEKPSYSPPKYPQSPTTQPRSTGPISTTPSTRTASEVKPEIGDGSRVFSAGNIRYCLSQDIRLEALRDLVIQNDDVDWFNEMISDINARCSSYRYRERDMSIARSDVAARTSDLQIEGRRLAETMPSRVRRSATPMPSVEPPEAAQPSDPSRNVTQAPPLPPPVDIGLAPGTPLDGAADATERTDLLRLEDASRVQLRLADLGYFGGIADGIWGPRSRTALRDFKIAHALAWDDAWDGQTETALFSASARSAKGPLTSKTDRWTPTNYPPPSGSSLNPLNKHDAVRIQHLLTTLGFYAGAGDGVWGLASRYALRDFKAVNKLPANDVWDAQTERVLKGVRPVPATDTAIGTWTTDSAACPAPQNPNPSALRITAGELENGQSICKLAGLAGTGREWSAFGDCTDGPRQFRFVVNGDQLIDMTDGSRTAYTRCRLR
jgi:peptidoglycan hydrolase-like protein with peptidoglycan-binding domain